MSTLVTNNVQLGSSGTTTNNFTIYQPTTPDGTVRIGSGNSGTTSNLVTIDSAGRVGLGKVPVSGRGVLQSADTIEVPSINGGQLAGMRNKIINGKMEIAQRGTSFAAAASGTYTLDRWQFSFLSTSVQTVSQQADVPSNNEFQNSLRVAITTADTSIGSTDFAFLRQHIEGYNARDLIGKTFTLSFWVRSSKTGIHCVSLQNSGSDRSYILEYTVNAANTWEQKSLSVSGGLITAGTWNWTNGMGLAVIFSLAQGSSQQTTANAWQTGNFLATSSQVNCLDTVSNGSTTGIFAITGVQLEVGTVATPFEHRPYGAELALCQRYYEKSYNQSTALNTVTEVGSLFVAANGASSAEWNVTYQVLKRDTPSSVTIFSTAGGTGAFRDVSNSTNRTANVSASGQRGMRVYGSTASANAVATLHYEVTAEL